MSRRAFLVIFMLATAIRADAFAQSEAAKGKEIRLLVSHPPGGGYDVYARLAGRHLGRHLPGSPAIVVQNMPGAAGVLMANYLYTQAPRDGSVIALGPGSLATAALFRAPGARYDARRFSWIGSMNAEVGVSVAWRTSPVKTAQDLFTRELIVAGAASTDQSVLYSNALDRVLGMKMKVVPGYGGSAETALALERGEAQGIGAWNYSSILANRPNWLKDGSITILQQLSLARHPDLPDVPTVLEIARTEDERAVLKLVFAQSAMGRALLGPPDMAADAAADIRAGFAEMLEDPAFQADARQSRIEINQPMRARETIALVGELAASEPQIVARAAAAVASGPTPN